MLSFHCLTHSLAGDTIINPVINRIICIPVIPHYNMTVLTRTFAVPVICYSSWLPTDGSPLNMCAVES